jgi:hypothetical protein
MITQDDYDGEPKTKLTVTPINNTQVKKPTATKPFIGTSPFFQFGIIGKRQTPNNPVSKQKVRIVFIIIHSFLKGNTKLERGQINVDKLNTMC